MNPSRILFLDGNYWLALRGVDLGCSDWVERAFASAYNSPPAHNAELGQATSNGNVKPKLERMKNMKGRILRKLKESIPTPTWRSGLVFQTNTPPQAFQTSDISKQHKNQAETIFDVKEEKLALVHNADNEEKLVPSIRLKEECLHVCESKTAEIGAVSDLSLVTPSSAHRSLEVETETTSDSIPPPHLNLGAMEYHIDCDRIECKDKLLLIHDFEDKCPPGGKDSLVLYTTSLRGIRKTFEDCNTIRFLLESFRVVYSERDVSMHLEYRDELWRILGSRVVPPRLFIKGRYIGGADEVVGLHENGMLQGLLQGIPLSPSNCPCRGCAGMRFVLCTSCNGSRKVMAEGENRGGMSIRCPDCNENGLVKCSVCS
ncbi:hypothetical protein Sango_1979000 [Sesamum angolense]|uniref:Glutaredoxin domain-containing protein n=1 Tax=Sesamum angolense TaxID=2727404 RepID=A0AAE2BNK2_9LAMI|nr:hypothetical protein Sango_1979000 [Sesamum angolense]